MPVHLQVFRQEEVQRLQISVHLSMAYHGMAWHGHGMARHGSHVVAGFRSIADLQPLGVM
jgi:hypothetical protein